VLPEPRLTGCPFPDRAARVSSTPLFGSLPRSTPLPGRSLPRIRPEPPEADRTWSLPGLWHGDASWSPPFGADGPRLRSKCLGHFWKAGVGKFSRAPKLRIHDDAFRMHHTPNLRCRPTPFPSAFIRVHLRLTLLVFSPSSTSLKTRSTRMRPRPTPTYRLAAPLSAPVAPPPSSAAPTNTPPPPPFSPLAKPRLPDERRATSDERTAPAGLC